MFKFFQILVVLLFIQNIFAKDIELSNEIMEKIPNELIATILEYKGLEPDEKRKLLYGKRSSEIYWELKSRINDGGIIISLSKETEDLYGESFFSKNDINRVIFKADSVNYWECFKTWFEKYGKKVTSIKFDFFIGEVNEKYKSTFDACVKKMNSIALCCNYFENYLEKSKCNNKINIKLPYFFQNIKELTLGDDYTFPSKKEEPYTWSVVVNLLNRMPNLKTLNLEYMILKNQENQEILNTHKSLKKLNLYYVVSKDDSVLELLDKTNIESLRFDDRMINCCSNGCDFENLSIDNIKKLNLSSVKKFSVNELTMGFYKLVELINTMTNLEELILKSNDHIMSKENVEKLCLMESVKIFIADADSNLSYGIFDSGAFVEFMKSFPNIEILEVMNNDLEKINENLLKEVFDDNSDDSDSCNSKYFKNLKEVDLSETNIPTNCLIMLLDQMPELKKLSLSGNKFNSDDIDKMKNCPSLNLEKVQEVNLNKSKFDPEFLSYFLEDISPNVKTLSLDEVEWNCWYDDSFGCWWSYIMNCNAIKTIQNLYLKSFQTDTNTVIKLIENCPNLKIIDVTGIDFSEITKEQINFANDNRKLINIIGLDKLFYKNKQKT